MGWRAPSMLERLSGMVTAVGMFCKLCRVSRDMSAVCCRLFEEKSRLPSSALSASALKVPLDWRESDGDTFTSIVPRGETGTTGASWSKSFLV